MSSSLIIRSMPQFDKVTFLTQVHWLLISFFFLYYVLLIYTPFLMMVLKLRKKRINYYNNLAENAQLLNDKNSGLFTNVIQNISNISKQIVTKQSSALNCWVNNYLNKLFTKDIKTFSFSCFELNLFIKTKLNENL